MVHLKLKFNWVPCAEFGNVRWEETIPGFNQHSAGLCTPSQAGSSSKHPSPKFPKSPETQPTFLFMGPSAQSWSFPNGSLGNESTCNARDIGDVFPSLRDVYQIHRICKDYTNKQNYMLLTYYITIHFLVN